jgi:hypothetical protein
MAITDRPNAPSERCPDEFVAPLLATHTEGEIMNIGKALLISVLLLLGLSAAQAAAAAAGGVPSIDVRVRVLETTVAGQGTAGASLQLQVNAIDDDIASLLSQLATLETTLALRLPMFAVVKRDGTLLASRGVLSAAQSLDSGDPVTGHYDVFFARNDVSLCAVTVTGEPSYSGVITATINGTFRGIPNPNTSPNQFHIVLSDENGDRIDSRFNVIVTC